MTTSFNPRNNTLDAIITPIEHMRQLRLKKIKLLSQHDRGRKNEPELDAYSWVSTICSSLGIAKIKIKENTSGYTMEMRTHVHCCSPQNGSTL